MLHRLSLLLLLLLLLLRFEASSALSDFDEGLASRVAHVVVSLMRPAAHQRRHLTAVPIYLYFVPASKRSRSNQAIDV